MVLQHFLTDSTTSDLAEEETEKEIFIQEKKKEKKVLKVRKCGRKTQKIIYHDFSDLLPLFQGFFCAGGKYDERVCAFRCEERNRVKRTKKRKIEQK